MKTEGLYISLSPDGTIKRRLSTRSGEVPLSDTTIADELIQKSESFLLSSVAIPLIKHNSASFDAELCLEKRRSYGRPIYSE